MEHLESTPHTTKKTPYMRSTFVLLAVLALAVTVHAHGAQVRNYCQISLFVLATGMVGKR
jgi:hypothetical protein